jgi:protein SCO1/2
MLPLLLAGTAVLAQASPLGQSPSEGQTIFQEKCAACHTVGQGKLVGPDLQGVTTRRERDWLVRWIKAPDKMLTDGDPIATQLLQEFNNVPMPNLGLTDQQVEALIAYLQTTESAPTTAPTALPALYVPTLIVTLVALLTLTALGFAMGRKRVEVRP